MASKINTDNPKHHKYTTVNKQERKKKIIFINYFNYIIINIFNLLNSNLVYNYDRAISNFETNYLSHRSKYNEHKPYMTDKGCNIVFDDCNHNSYRVIKNGKFIKNTYKNRKYSNRYIAEKHFKN